MLPARTSFQSTLPARGATENLIVEGHGRLISIHAPRTGSDLMLSGYFYSHYNFNPRSPHGERLADSHSRMRRMIFQSTLPARGATRGGGDDVGRVAAISIHAPRTGSDAVADALEAMSEGISIHAPRTGSDTRTAWRTPPRFLFQSTLPARGATTGLSITGSTETISIHAPRTGSDPQSLLTGKPSPYFNPRSPHGERQPGLFTSPVIFLNFNPRSPHGERPNTHMKIMLMETISIHAPRTGSDQRMKRLPVRSSISIHAPRTGSDQRGQPRWQFDFISIHAPRTGSDFVARQLVH